MEQVLTEFDRLKVDIGATVRPLDCYHDFRVTKQGKIILKRLSKAHETCDITPHQICPRFCNQVFSFVSVGAVYRSGGKVSRKAHGLF